MTTIYMTDDENILELYHRISENEQELNDILTIDDGDTNIKDLDLQLVEKLEWKPEKEGTFTFYINGNTYTVEVEDFIPDSIVESFEWGGGESSFSDYYEWSADDDPQIETSTVYDGDYSLDFSGGSQDDSIFNTSLPPTSDARPKQGGEVWVHIYPDNSSSRPSFGMFIDEEDVDTSGRLENQSVWAGIIKNEGFLSVGSPETRTQDGGIDTDSFSISSQWYRLVIRAYDDDVETIEVDCWTLNGTEPDTKVASVSMDTTDEDYSGIPQDEGLFGFQNDGSGAGTFQAYFDDVVLKQIETHKM